MRLQTDHNGISFFFFFVNRLKLLSWTGMNFLSLFHFWLLVAFLLYSFGLNDFLKTNLYDFARYKEHRVCAFKPGLHVQRKHKHKHKHKYKDVYTCDKHKHKVTYASAEA